VESDRVPGDRCPACAARVPAGADWCGLCYADLRPAPPAPAPVERPDPLTAPLPAVEAALDLDPIDVDVREPLTVGAPAPAGRRTGRHRAASAAPGWPCLRCDAHNDVADDVCAQCGAGFLSGVETAELVVPGLGPTSRIEKTHKVALVVGGTVVVMALLLVIAMLLGTVL
jgi:ribosomal protein L40E